MSYQGFLSLHIPNILITLHTKLGGEDKGKNISGFFSQEIFTRAPLAVCIACVGY